MKLLLRTIGQTTGWGDDITDDCECAVVDLTPELLERIRRRAAIVRDARHADMAVNEIEFGGAFDVDAYDYEFLSAAIDADNWEGNEDYNAAFYDNGMTEFPPAFDLAKYAEHEQRIDIERMIVETPAIHLCEDLDEYDVHWEFYAKHGDVNLHTVRVNIGELTKMLAAAPVAA